MRVFVIGARGFPGVQGGIEKHCEELYRRLVKKGELDITVIAISKYGNKDLKDWEGIKYKYIGSINSKNLEKPYYGLKASLYTIFKRPDLVHFQGLNCAIYIPFIKLFGIKVIYTQHSGDYLYPKWGTLARLVLRASERAGLMADKIIAVSSLINRHLAKFTDKSIFISNGINITHFNVSGEEEGRLLSGYGLKKNEYIFFAGRFTEEKSIEDLIEAYNQINNTGFKLVLAGDSEYGTKYSKMIKDLALKSKGIVLTGFIKGKELQILFSNARLFVLPSKHEGFPMVLLEALSYGIEILASDIEANRQIDLDWINFFKQGDVEDLRSKMLYCLNKDVKKEEKIARFNVLRDKYNWDKIAEDTYKLYKEIV